MEASLVTTKPVQWSSDLQPVRALYSEAEACGSLCLSGWAGVCLYQCVQSSMKVIWHVFFFYLRAIWVGRFGAGGAGGGSRKTRAKKQVWRELKHQYREAPSGMQVGGDQIITVWSHTDKMTSHLKPIQWCGKTELKDKGGGSIHPENERQWPLLPLITIMHHLLQTGFSPTAVEELEIDHIHYWRRNTHSSLHVTKMDHSANLFAIMI